MELNYRTLGQGQPFVFLHGIFGTSDNWQSFGKALSDQYKVYLVDLRNHGNSPHSQEFTYAAMADDLKVFIEQHHLENPIILGHSMGGKVAMFFAVTYPDLFDKLIIVDIAPRFYPVHHQQILKGLGAVKIKEISSRKEAETQMAEYISDLGVQQFLLKNLKRTDHGHFDWKLNLPVIRDNIEKVGEAVPTHHPIEKPVLFVRGGQSDYIKESDEDDIYRIFPQAKIATIKNAGHWVHAEQPEALQDEVLKFLQ